jgi:hypothetical protein
MSAMDLTLRIRTQIGMWRIHEVNRADTVGQLKRRLEKEHNIDLTHCPLTREPTKGDASSSSAPIEGIYRESMTVAEAQLTNGQILHLRIGGQCISLCSPLSALLRAALLPLSILLSHRSSFRSALHAALLTLSILLFVLLS